MSHPVQILTVVLDSSGERQAKFVVKLGSAMDPNLDEVIAEVRGMTLTFAQSWMRLCESEVTWLSHGEI